ncbi:YkgJ family cysteine cluster protein [Pseudodesulfovibrio sp. F-1]|uniref:YkgJ family cysteine cluster protein n=1 Tax=Pseudodesulfovibrio alkaliphilus TaxID=2661613 RepID=A0A7K1KPJ7_9BACT|nr:YkgJ family cysteine cluster protein [Pseudodesulfovibrio alkaliphilus]MUM78014.1 YkgJ family cysteine cluster protein [Pseudodesulfovibrio alkaliphilus]
MALDFSEYFKRYEAIVAEVETVFDKFETEMGDLVKCGKGCSDCCHALFDITLAEAIYINHKFNELFSGLERSNVLNRADTADRQIHKLKRKVFKASQEGRPASEILLEVSRARVRCPMLSDDNLCVMYEHRPITCRLYGVPTSIAGEAHTCKLSGFKGGEKYPTVNMDIILDRLIGIGRDLQKGIGSRYKELGDMLVPLSMALVTDYDEEYLGVNVPDKVVGSDRQTAASATKAPAPRPITIKAPGGAGDACSSCTESKSACESCTSNTIVLGGGEGQA